MSARAAITLACAALGLVAAALVHQWKGRARGEAGPVELFRPDPAALEAPAPESEGPEWIRPFPDSTLRRYCIPPERAAKLFPLDSPYLRYDEQAYFVREPHVDVVRELAEHPRGRWHLRTNALGMRRDSEPAATPPDLRVLVSGDSHADGLCDNAEAFPALAEEALERLHPGRSVEVLNASVGGYSPYNHLGVLERFLELEPDVFVMWVTASNDFTDVLLYAHLFSGDRGQGAWSMDEVDRRRREWALKVDPSVDSAGYGALFFFDRFPGELEVALDVCAQVLEEVRRTCDHHGVRPLVLYLPPPVLMPWQREVENAALLREIYALDEERLALGDELGRRFLELCRAAGVPARDLGPLLGPRADECFYRGDLHLNAQGHAVVASFLTEVLADAPELTQGR